MQGLPLTFKQCSASPFGNMWNFVNSPVLMMKDTILLQVLESNCSKDISVQFYGIMYNKNEGLRSENSVL